MHDKTIIRKESKILTKFKDISKFKLRTLSLIGSSLLLIVFAVSGYQTWQAETQLQQLQAKNLKGDYNSAAAQLDRTSAILVWPATRAKVAAAKAQNTQFQSYAKSLRLANLFSTAELLDNASAELAKIDKSFPEYPKVIALQKSIADQKTAAIHQTLLDSQTLSGPIQVTGDANCRASTQAALNLLQAKAPLPLT